MRPIRSVIFDWDGTLAQTLDLWVDGYHAALGRRGHSYPRDYLARTFLTDHHLIPGLHPELDFPVVVSEVRAHFHDALTGLELYDSATAVLTTLAARGLQLALVSSSPRATLEKGLAVHGLTPAFQTVIAGDDGFGHKPDPAPFAEALRRLAATPAETLIIGDSHVDILAGRSLGLQTCWFAPDHNAAFHDFTRVEGLGADHRATSLTDLLALIPA